MPVRIPTAEDVERQRVQNTRTVIDAPVDPMGAVYANLGERGRAIAARLSEQQTENEVLAADLRATLELDRISREVEAGPDPTLYESQYQSRAEAALRTHGEAMSGNGRRLWERRSAELMTRGVIGVREGAQRRFVDTARAGVRQVAAEAETVIADPNASEEARQAALERVQMAAAKAHKRGLLSADDAAQIVTQAQAVREAQRRETGLLAEVQAEADRIFAEHDTFAERLAAARAHPNPVVRERLEDEATQRQGRDNAARDEVHGAVLQAYLNGEDYRALPEYQRLRDEPSFADAHLRFREIVRSDAARAAANNAPSQQQSEALGDELEVIGVEDQRALMAIVDVATGRRSVGTPYMNQTERRIIQFDMSPAEFRRRTGMSVEQARATWSNMNADDRLRVLNRRNGAGEATDVDNAAAIDAATRRVLEVAEPLAEAAGFAVTGTADRNAQTRGQFRAFIYRETSNFVRANGAAALDDAARNTIARRALAGARRGSRGDRRADFIANSEGFPRYADIPIADQRALVAQWRAENPDARPDRITIEMWVEDRYADMNRGGR